MTNSFLDGLIAQDKAFFKTINAGWTHPILDAIMPWVRNASNWYPFYAILLGYVFFKWGKKAWKWILLVIVNISLTDQISSNIFKPYFHRLRPCADASMSQHLRLLLDHCSGGFSFTSSHAANHFGIAMFVVMSMSPLFKNYRYLFFVWAALIAYAQVYVGVHYPLDVFAGSIIGLIVGYLNGLLYNKWQNHTITSNE